MQGSDVVMPEIELTCSRAIETFAGPGLDAAEVQSIRARADPQSPRAAGGEGGDVIAAQRIMRGEVVTVGLESPALGITEIEAAAPDAHPETGLPCCHQCAYVAFADRV